MNILQAPVTVHSNVNFLEGGTINGVDVSALKEKVVFLEGDQIITAPMVRTTKCCIYSKMNVP